MSHNINITHRQTFIFIFISRAKYWIYFTECQSNAAKTRKLTLVKDTPETVKCQNEIF